MQRVTNRWKVGDYTFEEIEGHGFSEWEGQPLYRFEIQGQRQGLNELFPSLDHALVAAVGQRWTGHRGAGGSGVDTAAGWFMRMIGADRLLDEAATLKALETSVERLPAVVRDPRTYGRELAGELERQGFGLSQR